MVKIHPPRGRLEAQGPRVGSGFGISQALNIPPPTPLHLWLLSRTVCSGSLSPSFSLSISAKCREVNGRAGLWQETRQVEKCAVLLGEGGL